VIGTGGEIVGSNSAAPTIGPDYMRVTRSSKWFRGNNPTASATDWAWMQWYRLRDYSTSHNTLVLRDNAVAGDNGPLFQDETKSDNTTLSTTSNGTTNNSNKFPSASGAGVIDGVHVNGMSYDTGISQKLGVLFSGRFQGYTDTVYNEHAKVRIGGSNEGTGQDWRASNAEYYATVGFDVPLTESQLLAVRYAVVGSGLHTAWGEVAGLISLGDSTTANRWNGQLATSHGGAWRYKYAGGNVLGVTEGAMGGSDFSYHYGLQAAIITTLNTLPYAERFFVYTVDRPSGMANSASWDAIGVTEDDTEGYYAKVEEWAQAIEAATGATIVLGSYIGGTAGGGESDRDEVAAMTSTNGWGFSDFWSDPHSQVLTTAYGFYADVIHQTTAGSEVQAELFAASVDHPYNTSAPQFDPANPPTISGTETVGQTLSVTTGTPKVAPDSYTFHWLNNLTEIGGATSSTFTLRASDEGDRISCRVTAVKAGENSASFTSAPTGPIAAA
jgi:hypothetical protein